MSPARTTGWDSQEHLGLCLRTGRGKDVELNTACPRSANEPEHHETPGGAYVQRTIKSAIAFLSSLVSGTFFSASPLGTSNSDPPDSSLSPPASLKPWPSREDARSSPARRPISTSSTELGPSSFTSTSLYFFAIWARCRSSSGVKRGKILRRREVVQRRVVVAVALQTVDVDRALSAR